VIVDPSHGTGTAYMVTPLARAGVAAGADGLMIEVHNQPELFAFRQRTGANVFGVRAAHRGSSRDSRACLIEWKLNDLTSIVMLSEAKHPWQFLKRDWSRRRSEILRFAQNDICESREAESKHGPADR